ncbi:hypothetical protein AG1IA_09712 [Rhizoctonia solani AG-1 IA]|uniref:Uncharacterized protein n=1 Tax=Thanatephorus cucumeris (strain AG1-IA) TaxID=983506 RepID=L8WHJ7_THACA|nr:hypothetical protein AG1IA_09712 [Rhizoctonia solani AG-1 IA]
MFSAHFNNCQKRAEDTTHALSGNQTSRERKDPNLSALGASGLPGVGDVGTDDHGDRVVGLRNDKAETDTVPVRDPLVVLLWDPEVLDYDGCRGGDTEGNGAHAGGVRDG